MSAAERPLKAARTLCIDIGGTGLKVMVVGADGRPLTGRARVDTPRPATPAAVLKALRKLVAAQGSFDRVSVGFPGVVAEGVVKTAPNLHPKWANLDVEAAIRDLTGKPTRAINDAGVQGLGAIRGRGVEMCITLGTGFGCSLFVDGRYVPNLELAHHPFHRGRSYEEYVGAKALARVGKKKWNRRVARVVARLAPIFNYRTLYIGGGNARKLSIDLPRNVRAISNQDGLLGGVRLWERV
jgi:polyphosphate glucokinase